MATPSSTRAKYHFNTDFSQIANYNDADCANEEERMIYKFKWVLTDYKFPDALFLESSHAEQGFTNKTFAKLLRIFKGKDENFIRAMIQVGIARSIFVAQDIATPAQFVQWIKYLRTPEGNLAVTNRLRANKKLQNHREEHFSDEQIASLTAFEHQRACYAQEKKKINERFQDNLSKLEEQIVELKKTRAADELSLKRSFLPSSDYQPLEKTEVQLEAWAIMKREERAYAETDAHSTVLHRAFQKYGERVKKAHVLKFLQERENVGFAEEGNKKKPKLF